MVLLSVIFLVLCWAFGQSASHFHVIKKTRSWVQAREFCRTHYADLAVLSTEEHYLRLQDTITAQKATFWLGLKRTSISTEKSTEHWKWIGNEDLSYDRWFQSELRRRMWEFRGGCQR